MKKRIVFTITGDMLYDQRMQKICGTLADSGYDVLLLGFKKNRPAQPLPQSTFQQVRLSLLFYRGPLFFMEANIRILCYLLFRKFNVICAIDLDTIIPVYLLSVLKKKTRIFDAHELFCETHDLVLKPRIRKVWLLIERFFLPKFKLGYTVNKSLAAEYKNLYGLDYEVIRNLPVTQNAQEATANKPNKNILYQGVVSRGRGVEYFIPAMRHVNSRLILCGEGDFFDEAKALVKKYKLENKVELKGLVSPEQLKKITASSYIGLNTIENKGRSYFLSLSNRTFDYMNAAIPQIAMNYPEYALINQEFEIAILIDTLDEASVAGAINTLLNDAVYYTRLQNNCLKACEQLNWEKESVKLIHFYNHII